MQQQITVISTNVPENETQIHKTPFTSRELGSRAESLHNAQCTLSLTRIPNMIQFCSNCRRIAWQLRQIAPSKIALSLSPPPPQKGAGASFWATKARRGSPFKWMSWPYGRRKIVCKSHYKIAYQEWYAKVWTQPCAPFTSRNLGLWQDCFNYARNPKSRQNEQCVLGCHYS